MTPGVRSRARDGPARRVMGAAEELMVELLVRPPSRAEAVGQAERVVFTDRCSKRRGPPRGGPRSR